MALSNETTATLGTLVETAASICEAAGGVSGKAAAFVLRKWGKGAIVKAAEVLGIREIVRVTVAPGATVGGDVTF